MNASVATMPLGKVAERNERADPQDYPDMPYIGLDDVEAHTMRVIGWKSAGNLKSSAKKFYKRDVLYSRLRPYLNKIWVADRDGLCSSEFIVLPEQQDIDPKFLAYRINARDFVAFANSLNSGDRPRVNFRQISPFGIPDFDVDEQRLIVEKIETLFSELDKGVESLKTARQQLKAYRQAVLKHAFEGKLTEQWRQQNPDKLEPPEQLLARIQQERKQLYQQQLEEWKQAVKAWEDNGETGKKPSKPKALKEISALGGEVVSSLPEVPSSWVWGKLGLMTCGVEYGTSAKSSGVGDVPVVRMGNLQSGVIDWSDLVFTSDKEEIGKYSLQEGDVLFNRTNSPELVGKTAIYKGEKEALFAGYLIRVNHISSIVDGRYLNYFLNSLIAKGHGNTVKTDGVNQSNINGEKLKGYPFPFCSLDEQVGIVTMLDEKLSTAEKTLKDIGAQLEKAEALRQSILKKAFSGQLVGDALNAY